MVAQGVPPHRPAPKGALSATGPAASRGRRGVGLRSARTTMDRIFVVIIISALLMILAVPGLILVSKHEMCTKPGRLWTRDSAEATPLVPRLNIGALPPARGTVGLSFG